MQFYSSGDVFRLWDGDIRLIAKKILSIEGEMGFLADTRVGIVLQGVVSGGAIVVIVVRGHESTGVDS